MNCSNKILFQTPGNNFSWSFNLTFSYVYIHWIIQSSYTILRKNGPQYFIPVIFSLKYRNHLFLTCKVDWWKRRKCLGHCIWTYKPYMLFLLSTQDMYQKDISKLTYNTMQCKFLYWAIVGWQCDQITAASCSGNTCQPIITQPITFTRILFDTMWKSVLILLT